MGVCARVHECMYVCVHVCIINYISCTLLSLPELELPVTSRLIGVEFTLRCALVPDVEATKSVCHKLNWIDRWLADQLIFDALI